MTHKSLFCCAALILFISGCDQGAQAPSNPSVSGALFHLERIALPPESTMIVELRAGQAPNATLVTSYSEALEGRQVPFAFELEIPAEHREIDSSLFFRGGVRTATGLWLTESIAVEPPSDGTLDLGEVRLRRGDQVAFGMPFACGEHSVAFGTFGLKPRLLVNGEAFDIVEKIAASGARYQSQDDSATEFWGKGDEAMLVTVRGEQLPDCRRIKAPEMPFTAQGQEPGWQLRMTGQAIELTENYGARQSSFPHVEPTITAGGIVHYRTTNDDHELEIFVEASLCRDAMSGMPHPATVRYALDGEMSNGCGGAPQDLLLGDEWRVSSIAGEAVLEDAAPTIEFLAEDHRVAGLAGCNRFTGTFELTGENLDFSPLAVTRMACAEPGIQEQEDRFVEVLQNTVRFEMPGFDRLHLITSDDEVIEASR